MSRLEEELGELSFLVDRLGLVQENEMREEGCLVLAELERPGKTGRALARQVPLSVDDELENARRGVARLSRELPKGIARCRARLERLEAVLQELAVVLVLEDV